MGSDAKASYGAVGRGDLLFFEPESLVIVTDKAHALYDERVDPESGGFLPLDERLVRSIMARGVLEPIIIRKNGETKKGKPIVEVVDGRQRVRCAIEANKRLKAEHKEAVRVPGVQKRGDDGDLFGVMISTNEIRQQDTPMVRARKLGRYLDLGRTVEDAAVTFGVSVATCKNYLAMLDCAKPVQEAVESGEMPMRVAKELFPLPKGEQATALESMRAEGKLNGAAAKETAAEVRGPKRGKPQRIRTMRKLKEIEAMKGKVKSKDAIAALEWVLGTRAGLTL